MRERVGISASSSLSSCSGSILEGGCLRCVLCFHFRTVALVPKAKRCRAISRDLRHEPSGSSKATTREEEEPAM